MEQFGAPRWHLVQTHRPILRVALMFNIAFAHPSLSPRSYIAYVRPFFFFLSLPLSVVETIQYSSFLSLRTGDMFWTMVKAHSSLTCLYIGTLSRHPFLKDGHFVSSLSCSHALPKSTPFAPNILCCCWIYFSLSPMFRLISLEISTAMVQITIRSVLYPFPSCW